MMTIQRFSQASLVGRTIGASLGIAALAATVGCGVNDGATVSAQPLASAAPQQAGSPVMVTCEPNQRTLVRPVVVNGAALSQVECVSANTTAVAAQTFAPAPAAPAEYRPVRAQSAPSDLGDARVVTTEQPVTTARAIPTRQVVYRDEVPARKKRTVAKSAVIIGSTAGAGAGVGALIGGKKGAVIGAVAGAGGATLWDQITRRQK